MSNFRVAFKYTALTTLITVLSVSGVGINSQVWGQTIEEQEVEKLKNKIEIEELKKEFEDKKKATAEAEKARIEAEKAKAEASLPDIDSSKAPLGTISVDKTVKFENQILAYQAMDRVVEVVASEIQTELTDKLGSKVSLVISNEQVVPDALAKLDYKLFEARVKSIKKDYQELIGVNQQNPPINRFPAPRNSRIQENRALALFSPRNATTVSFLFDLLPFFRVNKTYAETSVDITTKAFVAKLTSKFRESAQSNISVYYPAEYSLITEGGINSILEDMSNLQKLKRQVENIKSKLTKEQLSKLNKVNESFDGLVTDLKNKNTFQGIASSQSFQSIANSGQNNIYFLSVKILAGGTNRTSQSFLRNRLRHSGAVIVKYIVYDRNASIVFSNVHTSYTGFIKVPSSK